MARIEADLEALIALRQTLRNFAERQIEAMQHGDLAITDTLRSLEESITRGRERVRMEPRTEEHLRWLEHENYQMRELAARYAYAAERWYRFLDEEVARALIFLDHRIAALEAYHQVGRSTSAQSAAPASSQRSLMGDFIQAIRSRQQQIIRRLGETGRALVAQILSERFGIILLDDEPTAHANRLVYLLPGIPVLYVEFITAPAAAKEGKCNTLIGEVVRQSMEYRRRKGIPEPALAVVSQPSLPLPQVYLRREHGAWEDFDAS